MLTQNKEAVRRYLAASNRGDVPGMLDCLDKRSFRLCCHGGPPIGYLLDFKGFCAMLDKLGQVLAEPLWIEIDCMTAEESRVAVQAHSFAPRSAGGSYSNEYHFLFTIDDGRIVRIDEYLCTLTLMQSLDATVWEEAVRLEKGA
jgi:ketosteroid isomerase-like protein